MSKELSDSEMQEVNRIVNTLQHDLDNVIDHTKKQNFNEALKNILEGMSHTSCPICKQKLTLLSTKIIEAKKSCKDSDSKCDLIIKETIEKANSIKDNFIPIATEKRFVKSKETELKKHGRAFKFPDLKSTLFPKGFPLPDPLRLLKKN